MIKKLDVSNRACPVPLMLTKQNLRDMKFGDILEIIGDFPLAKDNIVRWAEKNGHDIIDVQVDGLNFIIKLKKN